jgi:Protein-tyrosine-phosphatase-like, N-terminal domain
MMDMEQRLQAEFAGVLSPATVTAAITDFATRWATAPIQAYVAMLTERFARKRLQLAADSIGQVTV